jgi:hypothetical protein
MTGTPNYTPNNLHTVGRQINSLLPGAILNLNLFGSILSNSSNKNAPEKNEAEEDNTKDLS